MEILRVKIKFGEEFSAVVRKGIKISEVVREPETVGNRSPRASEATFWL